MVRADERPADASGGFRKHWPVAVFTVGYLTVALIGATLRGNLEFLFYIARSEERRVGKECRL